MWMVFGASLALMMIFFRGEKKGKKYKNVLTSPANGKIYKITKNPGENTTTVSIILSLLNKHVQHYPFSGVIKHQKFLKGCSVPITNGDKSDFNQKVITVLQTKRFGDVTIEQYGGFLTRKIEVFGKIGDRAEQATAMGLIRFGSRLDLSFGSDCVELLKQIGDTVSINEPLVKKKVCFSNAFKH
jgi:phosphatidylserine decarboxylase